ncbi:hypothetical protein OZX58_07920 [Lactobacillus sp. ESL0680]|uniref:hypothetical protein n=1 Tax=Lactobacillus sp. ESL0680 TaxID=2983210 RepID=UPI0023F807DA|nr:hypothetical protein [Lactobacillus sp. ESL0680]WEV38649.1 hypothetical protein OZX58_07920 [Lactobacillus sp. ESL0680]
MKKSFKLILTTLLMTTTLSIANLTSKSQVSAQLVSNSSLSSKAWTKKLAEAGYVFELPNSNKGALYKNTAAKGGKPYTKKVLEKILKQHTLFKVKKLTKVKNGISVDLVSKNGKYKGYTTYINGIYNKNLSNKDLQPLINAELSAIDAKDNNKPTSALLEQAQTLASGLTGKNKQIADTSIKQLKQFLKHDDLSETPVLLIGKYPSNLLAN